MYRTSYCTITKIVRYRASYHTYNSCNVKSHAYIVPYNLAHCISTVEKKSCREKSCREK